MNLREGRATSQAAQASGVSKSRWGAEIIRKHAANEWPQDCLALAGRFSDFPLRDELMSESFRECPDCSAWIGTPQRDPAALPPEFRELASERNVPPALVIDRDGHVERDHADQRHHREPR